ncbi:MAG: hypothetical protein LPJ89_09370 [Hymenobacteraceae bacterium]|nr:hypothetical protein [Hymenobacteraceae bacterium]MDX5397833.1 hypothetical protein [Hymenobacteraceae bacterium]MDX5443975.1 hypothetical protein [Hymenobacteraceae bacterium]MDX5513910.1 hypothetical protein [Hymenobacteraceae bacterium]
MASKENFKHVLFVLNPISGDIEKQELEDDLAAFCQEKGIRSSFYKTTGSNDKAHIKNFIEVEKPDAVFALGGDGTVSIVGDLLIHTSVPLGIIPLGSGNGLSKDLGIPQDVEEAMQLISNHQIRRIDTVSINGHYSIHLSDLGFNALVVKRFCEGNSRGPGSYAWLALQEYLAYEPKHYKIITEKETFNGAAFMVTVANANAFGTNANINPGGILNDGLFEICLIEPFPKAAGIAILYKLYTDSIDNSVYTRTISCRKATIYNLDDEYMHIDGEPVDLGKELHLEIHPKSLKVVLPLPKLY